MALEEAGRRLLAVAAFAAAVTAEGVRRTPARMYPDDGFGSGGGPREGNTVPLSAPRAPCPWVGLQPWRRSPCALPRQVGRLQRHDGDDTRGRGDDTADSVHATFTAADRVAPDGT